MKLEKHIKDFQKNKNKLGYGSVTSSFISISDKREDVSPTATSSLLY
ncbi:MAG: hypothetical protein LBJ98_03440 [Endomicrobium sp.]|nr:hypothetical protein [Endomicrobium sp.]